MTVEYLPRLGAPPCPGVQLSAPGLRRTLLAVVRRSVPRDDAEDIVQAVLCEALASPTRPEEPHALARWVVGIARHKVADFHRRARRAPAELADEPAGVPVSFEARETLREILADVAHDPRTREAVEWILRESTGESLRAIADDEGVTAPLVRQRVSRLRRHLRARWLLPLVACGVVAALLVALATRSHVPRAPVLEAEPPPPVRTTSEAATRMEGAWRVVLVEPAVPVGPARRLALQAQAALTRVEIHGARLRVAAPTFRAERSIELLSAQGASATGVLRDGASEEHVAARFGPGGRLTITTRSGPFAGTVTLER